MVQIDYEITIFYKAFFIKKSFWGRCLRTPAKGDSDNSYDPPLDPPAAVVWGQAPPHRWGMGSKHS